MFKNKKLLLLLLVFLVLEAVLTGVMPLSNGLLFGYLNTKNTAIWTALILYVLNYLSIDVVQCIKPYLVAKLALVHRFHRTTKVLTNGTNNKVTNKPQRIQEDIKFSYFNRITVWSEYLISGLILIQLLCMNLHYPILVLAAIIYSVVSILIAIRFNPKLTYAEKSVQNIEADFRTFLSHKVLGQANELTLKAARIRSEYMLFTRVQSAIMSVLPFIVLIPLYMHGVIDLGTVMKHQATFGLIVVNATVLIQMYTTYVAGQASEERVRELESSSREV